MISTPLRKPYAIGSGMGPNICYTRFQNWLPVCRLVSFLSVADPPLGTGLTILGLAYTRIFQVIEPN